jgi:hypothetical protein
MLSKRIIYISQHPLRLIKCALHFSGRNSSFASVPEEKGSLIIKNILIIFLLEISQQKSKQVRIFNKENFFPTHFAPSRGIGRPIYSLIPGPKGELLADYVLFEETMKRQRVPWLCYNKMTGEEKTIYIEHFKAIEARRLWYFFKSFLGFLLYQLIKFFSYIEYNLLDF